MVVREEKHASRMSGVSLGLERVRKNKVVVRVLNVEHVEAAEACSSWSERVAHYSNALSQLSIRYITWLR